jgi:hypothetical protein
MMPPTTDTTVWDEVDQDGWTTDDPSIWSSDD